MMQTSDAHVVIVGAGPGGLGAAMLAASAGLRVTLVETRDRVGGRTSTFEQDGFRFDLGPTFFLYPEALRSLFRLCGLRLDDTIDLLRVDPHYRLVFGGDTSLDVTPDPDEMVRRIARIAPQDAASFKRFLADNRRKLSKATPILQQPFSSARDLLRIPLWDLLTVMRPWASVDADLRNYFEDPRIRLAFSFQSKYLGMSPFKCPSLFTILSFMEYEYGIYHPRGGCGALSQVMADLAVAMGVDLRLGTTVTGLDLDGRRVKAVETDRGSLPCDALVINADFAHAVRRLVPNHLRRRWSDQKLERKKYSCSTFMMYLGLEGEVDLPHHSIHLAEDYRRNLADIENDRRLSEDPSFYICNPVVTDPTMAPEGCTSLYVLVPVPHRTEGIDWRRDLEPFRTKMMAKLQDIGIDDIEKRIRFEKIVTPLTWETDLNIHLGSTFSLAHTVGQLLHLRPQNRFEELDGVFLVGGATHPGSGLPVIYESAKITTRLMAEDLGAPVDWTEQVEPPPEPLFHSVGGA
ncbi:MAG: phytoene desaturase family protein [Acidobacteriota bacterium]